MAQAFCTMLDSIKTGVITSTMLLVGLGLLAACSSDVVRPVGSAATGATAQPEPAKVAVTLSPDELKEQEARDTFASNLGKGLHLRVPAYKNVKIYADGYAGAKSPTKTPQTDPKTRVSDNLMLVFYSPDSGTAKGLAEFAKSKAARDAGDVGFAELQFVDLDTYCYALIATGVGPVKCGPR